MAKGFGVWKALYQGKGFVAVLFHGQRRKRAREQEIKLTPPSPSTIRANPFLRVELMV